MSGLIQRIHCNQELKKISLPKVGRIEMLKQVRCATIEDQFYLVDWLEKKHGKNQATRNEVEETMADWLSREQRSRNMASIRSKGNATTEKAFLRLLRDSGLSGWRRHVDLPGKPDFVFRSKRIAVFIDGCFWHGCPRCYRLPEDNRRYWKTKVLTNRTRDRRTTRRLRSLDWRVIRIWEHSLKSRLARSRVAAHLCKVFRSDSSL